jgi:hypothetical protein
MKSSRPADFHEDLRRHDEVKGSSNRGFGLVFAAVFALIGLAPLVHGQSIRLWSLGVAACFLGAAYGAPRLLTPLNRAWTRFGLLLHGVVNPLVMGLLFFVTITPIGFAMRALGKDPLRLKFDRMTNSYWIERRPPGPAPQSMRQQF